MEERGNSREPAAGRSPVIVSRYGDTVATALAATGSAAIFYQESTS